MTERNETSDGPIPNIQKLGETPPPPADLKEKVLRELHGKGHLKRPGNGLVNGVFSGKWAAAVLLAFAVGLIAGANFPASSSSPARANYLLLLKGAGTVDPEETSRRVAEYTTWARDLAQRELLVGADRLDVSGVRLEAGGVVEIQPTENFPVVGYFLIRASDFDEAIEIARECPHLSYNGQIEVHPIAGAGS